MLVQQGALVERRDGEALDFVAVEVFIVHHFVELERDEMSVDSVPDAVVARCCPVPSPDGKGPEAVQPERLVSGVGVVNLVDLESRLGHRCIGFMDRTVFQDDPEVVTSSDLSMEPFRPGIDAVLRFGKRFSID